MKRKRDEPIDEPTPMPGAGDATVVGAGANLEGDIVSAGSLRIDGNVKGSVDAAGDVFLSSQATVFADIRATNVTVAGRLTGNITAKAKAELSRSGRVDGDVTATSLVVEDGGVLNGRVVMDATAPPGAAEQSGSTGEG